MKNNIDWFSTFCHSFDKHGLNDNFFIEIVSAFNENNDQELALICQIEPNGPYRFFTQDSDKKEIKVELLEIYEYKTFKKMVESGKISGLSPAELPKLGKNPDHLWLAGPIFYRRKFFGFILYHSLGKKNPPSKQHALIRDMAKVLGMCLVANHLENELNYEHHKKEVFFSELCKTDKRLTEYKKSLLKCQKSEIVRDMMPLIFHKLKNKLTPILGYAQILLASIKDEGTAERLKKIEKGAYELSNHLSMLRDYFGDDKIIKEKENINHIINNLRPFFIDIKQNHNVVVKLDLDYAIHDDFLIPGQIESMIINLINNALMAIKIKAMDNGEVIITTKANTDGYSLSIKDNGIGIDRENIDNVWTPFFSTFPGRVGIGLSVCKKIIENNEATVHLDSIKGIYTDFHIEFRSSIPEKSENTSKEPLNPASSQKRILVVHDEKYLLEILKEVLEKDGDNLVTLVKNDEEAIEKSQDCHFDLLLTEEKRPGINILKLKEIVEKGNSIAMMIIEPDSGSEIKNHFPPSNRIFYWKPPLELMKLKRRLFDILL